MKVHDLVQHLLKLNQRAEIAGEDVILEIADVLGDPDQVEHTTLLAELS